MEYNKFVMCIPCFFFNKQDTLLHAKLEQSDHKCVNFFSFSNYECDAKVVHVYDGDSVHIVLPLRETGQLVKIKARLYGIDTPEMRVKEQKDRAILAKERLIQMLETTNFIVNIKCGEFDKYGRVLVQIYSSQFTKSLNQLLIDENHAYAYFGKTKIN